MMPRALLLLFTLLPLTATLNTAVADESMRLSVKPVLCITDKRTPSCQMSFLVLWESAQTGYYCLFNDFGETPIRCWSDERSGRTEDERIVENDFQYWMQDDSSELQLAVVTVEVLRLDSDDRRRKRRTRHVWDVN
ncbi:MAG: DUF3019 domain-containing protein [Gammaproteobacteria bacterium]|nr:DUF3019 domain-containing protein [Gammaproteobacteria bacterium]MDH3751178.1 DUF3019 domain-containing protein [Gammaproteobacteria bacterium]